MPRFTRLNRIFRMIFMIDMPYVRCWVFRKFGIKAGLHQILYNLINGRLFFDPSVTHSMSEPNTHQVNAHELFGGAIVHQPG